MNVSNDPTPHVDTALLDRLVDGELDDSARQALLRRLAAEPDGWRRCALAFLEAQAWRAALAPNGAGAALGSRAAGSDPARMPAAEGPARWLGARAAMAAAVLVAFASGWLSSTAARGPGATETGNHQPLAGRELEGPARRVAPTAPQPEPWQDRRRPAALPAALDAAAGPAEDLAESRPGFDPALRQWESRGYQVEQRRALMSMDLNDGRRVSLPVDEIEFRFVGNRTY